METLPATLPQRIKTTELVPAESYLRPKRRRIIGAAIAFGVSATVTFVLLNTFSSLILIVALLTIIGAVARVRMEDARAVETNQRAIALLNEGYIDEAAGAFEDLARTHSETAGHAVYVFNTGVAYMLQGRLRRAYATFNAVLLSRRFLYGAHGNHEALLLSEMAVAAALMDWREDAQRLLKRAAKRVPNDEMARLALADAVLSMRGGSPQLALEVIRRNGPSAEQLLRPPTIRALMVVRAFALEQLGRYEEADEAVLRLMPIRHGEFDWLGAEWPAMRAFLAQIRT